MHEAEIIKTDPSVMTAQQLSVDTVNKSATDSVADNGEKVNIESNDDALLYGSFTDLNPEVASQAISAYPGNIDMDVYVRGMGLGINYGRHNITPTEKTSFTYLPEALQRKALELGRQQSESETKAAQEGIKGLKRSGKQKGRVILEDSAKSAKMTEIQEESTKVAEIIAKVFDTDVYLYDSKVDKSRKDINGFIDGEDNIYIDISSGKNHEQTMLYTLSHEVTHLIKKWSPKKFKVFADFLMENYGTRGEMLLYNQIEKKLEAQRKKKGKRLDVDEVYDKVNMDEAYEEMIADACERMLIDSNAVEKLDELTKTEPTMVQKIKDFIKDALDKVREIYKSLAPQTEEAKQLSEMTDVLEKAYRLFEDAAVDAAEARRGAESGEVSGEGSVKNSIRNKFYDEYDAWDKKKSRFSFYIGNTSDVLKSLGIKDKKIRWDATKILKIMNDHPAMTDDVIKQVPSILENPVMVMKSRTVEGRLTLFGEVYDKNNAPVLAVLELNPLGNGGRELDIIKVASAYGKDVALQNFINKSEVVYTDKKRIHNWLNVNRLRLPLRSSSLDSTNSISKNDENVKFSRRDNSVTTQGIEESFGITKLGDYVHVQKQVFKTLQAEGFFTNEERTSRTDVNDETGIVIETNRKSINETFNYENYGKVSSSLKKEKLSTINLLPNIIKKARLIGVESNSKKQASSVEFIYLSADVRINGIEKEVKITVKKSPEKNRFYVHQIYYKESTGTTSDEIHNGITSAFYPNATDSVADITENVKYSRRGKSDRQLLIEMLDSISEDSKERSQKEQNIIDDYKTHIDELDEKQARLGEVRAEIRSMMFAEGKRDMDKYNKLIAEKKRLENDIYRQDRFLLQLEGTSTIRELVKIEKEKSYSSAVKHGKKVLEAKAERQSRTVMRNKVKKDLNDLSKLLLNGNKKRHVPQELQESVAAFLKMFNMETMNVESRLASSLARLEAGKAKVIEAGYKGEIDSLDDTADALTEIEDGISDEFERGMTRLEEAGYTEKIETANDMVKALTTIDKKLAAEIKKRMQELHKIRGTLLSLQTLYVRHAKTEKIGGNMQENLARLKRGYDEILGSNDAEIKWAFDKDVSETITTVSKNIGNTPIRNMSLKQLTDLHKLMRMVQSRISRANELFAQERKETVAELGNTAMKEIDIQGEKKKRRGEKLEGAYDFNWDHLKPIYAMEHINSGVLTSLYRSIRKGEDIYGVDTEEAKEFLEKTKKDYGYEKWDREKTYTFESKSGKEFELNLEAMLTIYALSKRKQADGHLDIGGFVYTEDIEAVKEGKFLHKKTKYKLKTDRALAISEVTIGKINMTLTQEQKNYVDKMVGYLSNTMGAKGNEVSMKLYGIELFNEKYYVPIKSSKDYLLRLNTDDSKKLLKNSGFTKETTPNANNPIVLDSFTKLWCQHVVDMSNYHAFVLPLEDFSRVYGYSTPRTTESNDGKGVKTSLKYVYGIGAEKYIDNFIADVNGGRMSDGMDKWSGKRVANFKRASVLASFSVTAQQPSAIVRALAYLDPTDFLTNPKGIKYKEEWAEVKKYAPVAIIKERGYFDTGMGQATVDWLMGDKSRTDKILDLMGSGAESADMRTWVYIWQATKRHVKKNSPALKGESYFEQCGKVFTEVIEKTQVYDSVFSRSQSMRSKDGLSKMANAFAAEGYTTLNMAIGAHDKAAKGTNKDEKKAGRKFFRRVYGSLLVNVLLNSALSSLPYAMRDDDEDETFGEKYIESFILEVLDGFNPLTYLYVVKDIWSIVQGYTVERTDLSGWSELISTGEELFSLIFEDTEDMDEEELKEHRQEIFDKSIDSIGWLGALYGLPVKNLIREARAIVNAGVTLKGYTTTTESRAGIKNAINNAWRNATFREDETKTDKLYDAVMKKESEYLERIKASWYEGSEKKFTEAKRKALKENDYRIKLAAQARYEGNATEYQRICKEIKAEGYFTQDDAVWAINSLYTAMKPKEESEELAAQSLFKTEDYFRAIDGGNSQDVSTVKRFLVQKYLNDGKDSEEAEDAFNSDVKSYLKDEYEKGNYTAQQAESFLTKYGGKSAEEAEYAVRCWETAAEYPDLDMTEKVMTNYFREVESSGISIEVFADYYERQKECESDKDKDGNSISGSKKAKIMDVIDSLPITDSQKDALYYYNVVHNQWKESTLNKAPWH